MAHMEYVWHRMLYSCRPTHVTTVGVKGLITSPKGCLLTILYHCHLVIGVGLCESYQSLSDINERVINLHD